jgi:hypothetical protein
MMTFELSSPRMTRHVDCEAWRLRVPSESRGAKVHSIPHRGAFRRSCRTANSAARITSSAARGVADTGAHQLCSCCGTHPCSLACLGSHAAGRSVHPMSRCNPVTRGETVVEAVLPVDVRHQPNRRHYDPSAGAMFPTYGCGMRHMLRTGRSHCQALRSPDSTSPVSSWSELAITGIGAGASASRYRARRKRQCERHLAVPRCPESK